MFNAIILIFNNYPYVISETYHSLCIIFIDWYGRQTNKNNRGVAIGLFW